MMINKRLIGMVEESKKDVYKRQAYNKALSANYGGSYYNQGTDVTVGTDGSLSGYTDIDCLLYTSRCV